MQQVIIFSYRVFNSGKAQMQASVPADEGSDVTGRF